MAQLLTRGELRSYLGGLRRATQARLALTTLRVGGPRLYFALVGEFVGEQTAVAAGRKLHDTAVKSHSGQMFLRRSIHRLEKGLSQPTLRGEFAADYILPAVRTAISMSPSRADLAETTWAGDVLDAYFAATSASTVRTIVEARKLWCARERVEVGRPTDDLLKPFPYSSFADATAFGEVREVASHRRSVRWYDQKPVPRSDVLEAIEVGLMGPSACNRQSFRVFLIEDEDLRRAVARVPMGTAGFSDQIPLLAVLVGQHRGYEHQRDRHAIFVDGGLFSTGFILALESKGLSSCCINWPELEEKNKKMRVLLDLDEDERVVMLIAVGYARQGQLVPRSQKRSADSVAVWR